MAAESILLTTVFVRLYPKADLETSIQVIYLRDNFSYFRDTLKLFIWETISGSMVGNEAEKSRKLIKNVQ